MKPPRDYFLQMQQQTAPKFVDEKPCSCGVDLIIQDYYSVCPECGTVHDANIQQDYGFVPQKRKFYYNKVSYFGKYLMTLQGMSAFNHQTHGVQIKKLFPETNPDITKKEIRHTLKVNNCSQKYLRYLPQIYYYVSGREPIVLRVRDVNEMVDKYRRVIDYSKRNNISLPSAKRYFAKKFLKELGKPYVNLCFFIEPFKHVDVSKYDEVFDELF